MRDAAIDTHRSPARGAARSRSSAAPALDDMVGEGSVSRGAPRRGGITSAAVAAQRLGGGRLAGTAPGCGTSGLAARLRGRFPRVRPLKALTVGAFGVALVGIVANAMVFQRGHHPAPLFGLGRSVDGAPDGTERTAAAPPPPAPIERTGAIAPPPAAPVGPAPAPAPVPAVAPAAAVQPSPAPVHRAVAKPRPEEAAKAKRPEAKHEAAAAHPRPGHAAAKAERTEDPVAKLLAASAHPAKADGKPTEKAASAAKPEGKAGPKAKSAAAPATRPQHRTAAEDGKPAAKTE